MTICICFPNLLTVSKSNGIFSNSFKMSFKYNMEYLIVDLSRQSTNSGVKKCYRDSQSTQFSKINLAKSMLYDYIMKI